MLREYIAARIIYYIGLLFVALILFLFQAIFDLKSIVTITIIVSSFITMSILFTIQYIAIELNFKRLKNKLSEIENPELITYYLNRPKHYESGYIYDLLEVIARSLYERYKQNIDNQIEFQEYLLMLVHDLKEPIQNLKLTANASSQSEIHAIEELVDHLLNYSKISLSAVDVKITAVDLKGVLDTVIKSNFEVILDKRIKVETDYQQTFVSTDQYWLTFIVKQLISNGIKYCQQSLKVAIVSELQTLKIIISNDGAILKPDELDLIFDKGYIGSNAALGATGYGLFYSKQIAEKLGYQLTVEVDDQTSFILSFNFINNEKL